MLSCYCVQRDWERQVVTTCPLVAVTRCSAAVCHVARQPMTSSHRAVIRATVHAYETFLLPVFRSQITQHGQKLHDTIAIQYSKAWSEAGREGAALTMETSTVTFGFGLIILPFWNYTPGNSGFSMKSLWQSLRQDFCRPVFIPVVQPTNFKAPTESEEVKTPRWFQHARCCCL